MMNEILREVRSLTTGLEEIFHLQSVFMKHLNSRKTEQTSRTAGKLLEIDKAVESCWHCPHLATMPGLARA
jgi:hypothetical protein